MGVWPIHHKLFHHNTCDHNIRQMSQGQIRGFTHAEGLRGGGKLTHKWSKYFESSFDVVHFFKHRWHALSSFGLTRPPVLLESVFHCQPKAVNQEEGTGNGVSSKVGHRKALKKKTQEIHQLITYMWENHNVLFWTNQFSYACDRSPLWGESAGWLFYGVESHKMITSQVTAKGKDRGIKMAAGTRMAVSLTYPDSEVTIL